MPKPSAIISAVASLMNDTEQAEYTNAACLPYLNIALNILQEIFELNDIPITHKSSGVIKVPGGYHSIGFDTTPALPADLIEIEQLWESTSGLNEWIPVTKKDFIPHYLQNNTSISQFLIWAWKDQHIEIIPANAPNDLKIDYIGSIFKTPILIANVNVNIQATNVETYLQFETAALCSMFIGENETRSAALNGFAGDALNRALGIPIKGMQTIVTRRMPFRAAFKRRGRIY